MVLSRDTRVAAAHGRLTVDGDEIEVEGCEGCWLCNQHTLSVVLNLVEVKPTCILPLNNGVK